MARFSKKYRVKKSRHNRKLGKKSGRKGKPCRTRLRLTRTLRKKSRRNVYTGGGLPELPKKTEIKDNKGAVIGHYVKLSDPESEELAEYRTKVE